MIIKANHPAVEFPCICEQYSFNSDSHPRIIHKSSDTSSEDEDHPEMDEGHYSGGVYHPVRNVPRASAALFRVRAGVGRAGGDEPKWEKAEEKSSSCRSQEEVVEMIEVLAESLRIASTRWAGSSIQTLLGARRARAGRRR